jgi:hypothetical protein
VAQAVSRVRLNAVFSMMLSCPRAGMDTDEKPVYDLLPSMKTIE